MKTLFSQCIAPSIVFIVTNVPVLAELPVGLYATDVNNDRVIRILLDGTWSSFASTADRPRGIAVHDNKLYATSSGTSGNNPSGHLQVIDGTGDIISTVTNIPSGGGFSNGTWPWGIVVMEDEVTYVATHNAANASRISSPTGSAVQTLINDPTLFWGKDAALGMDGNVYITSVLETNNNPTLIVKIDTTNNSVSTLAQIDEYVRGIVFDSGGNMYLTGRQTSTLYKINNGESTPSPIATLPFPDPQYMTIQPNGMLYIASVNEAEQLTDIYQFNLANNVSLLIAENLPIVNDIVWNVPEPSGLCAAIVSLIVLSHRRRRPGVHSVV